MKQRLSWNWNWVLFPLFPAIAITGFLFLVINYPFWTLCVTALMICILMTTYQIWLWWLLRILAQRDIVVTNVEEGTGKLTMKNRKANRFITADPKTDPDKNWNLAQEDGTPAPQFNGLRTKQEKLGKRLEWIDRYLLPGGMRWVGFKFMGYELFWYNFRRQELRESKPREDEKGLIGEPRQLPNGKWVASFVERINYIYIKDAVYYFEVKGAETKGSTYYDEKSKQTIAMVGMSVDISVNATVRITNGYLALIMIHDWLQSSFNLIEPSVRSWAQENFFPDIIGKPEVADRKYDTILQRTGVPKGEAKPGGEKPTTLVDYLESSYGVRFKRLGFVDVVPPKSYTDAMTAREAAEQNKIRTLIDANADAGAMEIRAAAEANRINTVNQALKDGGETAIKLRELEAFENIGESGNVFVVNTKDGGTLINLQKDKSKGKGGKKWGFSRKSEPPSEESEPA